MVYINNLSTSAATLIFLFCNIHHVGAAGRTVSDLRIQDHDITPVLRRGYSVATGALQSSCLNVVDRTEPTYDYDYFFTEFKDDSDASYESAWGGKIGATLSYGWAKGHVESSTSKQSTSNRKEKKHFIIATMRTERYYSSVDEVNSELSKDSRQLLESGQYISFFQACGPNYVRSIRRAAEVTAIFEYESTETGSNSEFESNIKADISGYGQKGSAEASYSRKVGTNSLNSSLIITIKGFGLGLNVDGASTLVARTMESFQGVMDFAFQSMHTVGVGMVQGIEIVSWVDNPQFQVAAELSDTLQICQEEGIDGEAKEDGICSTVSLEMKKMTLSSNAEYVATMNSVMRKNIDRLYNMQHCRSILYGFSPLDKDKKLKNHHRDFVTARVNDESGITVEELKEDLDKKAMEKAQEHMKEYMDHFYSPCMDALSKDAGGKKGGVSLVTPWFSIEECEDVSCTVSGVTIKDGKCVFEDANDSILKIDQYCMPSLVGYE